jgi:hypothetical protein
MNNGLYKQNPEKNCLSVSIFLRQGLSLLEVGVEINILRSPYFKYLNK